MRLARKKYACHKFETIMISKEFFVPTDRSFKTHTRGIDLLYSLATVPVCFIWKNQILSFPALKESFARVLEKIPILAARLNRENGEWMLDVHKSRGCLFECWKTNRALPLETESDAAWTAYSFPVSRLETYSKGEMVKIRVTHFTNGTVIHVSFAHMLMDANGLHRMLTMWSNEVEQTASPLKCHFERTPSKGKVIPTTIMSRWQTVKVLFRMYRSISTFHIGVFTCDKDELVAWKRENQPDGGKWVSTNELILAMIWNQLKSTHPVHLIADIHGRCREVPIDYFGNGFHMLKIPPPPLDIGLNQTALTFHDTIRTTLDQPEVLDETYKRLDYLHHSGRFTALRSLDVVQDCGKGSLLYNSWTSFDWYSNSIQFGTGFPMDFMRIDSSFCGPRFVHVFPSRASRITIRLCLSSAEMKQFVTGLPTIWKTGYETR